MQSNSVTTKTAVVLCLERKPQNLNTLPFLPSPVVRGRGGLLSFLSNTDASAVAGTCVIFQQQSEVELNRRALIKLQRAVLDDDQDVVTTILESASPKRLEYILTTSPASIGIVVIESNTPGKSTWQRFISKKIFPMAQLLRRSEMTALIFRIFCEQEELKKELARQWVLPKFSNAELKAMEDHYIKEFCYPFIVTLAADNTMRVPLARNHNTGRYEAKILDLNQETKAAIDALKKMLLPDQAIDLEKLDTPSRLGAPGNYPDMEQFCNAAMQAYYEYSDVFENGDGREWDRRRAYSIVFVGLIITLLGPEHGKKFCAGIYDWANGCDVILMAPPQDATYKVSDKNNLYLYYQEGKILYCVENNLKLQYLSELKLPESAKFTATPTKLTKCLDAQLIAEVLKITSSRKHTFDHGRILSPAARALVMKDSLRFMRDSREFLSGAGINFVCTAWGTGREVGGGEEAPSPGWLGQPYIRELFQTNTAMFDELRQHLHGRRADHVVHDPPVKYQTRQFSCVIS